MPTIHDQANDTLDTVTGINGVQNGGTGADMTTTSGFVYQPSVGAAFTAIASPYIYIIATGLDQTAEIQAAIDVPGQHHVVFGSGAFLVTDTLTISQRGIAISGQGLMASIINFMPTSGGKPLFHFVGTAAGLLDRLSLRDIRLRSNDGTFQKIAVRVTSVTEFHMADVLIGPGGNWTGNGSIGLQTRGRDMGSIRHISIFADQPISIEPEVGSTFSLDHYHFQDCYLVAGDDTRPVIKIASGANVTNLVFDGYQSWNNGSDGLSFVDTDTTQVNGPIRIANVRWEQGASNGYVIRYSSKHPMRRLILENIYVGTLGQFAYIRGVVWLRLSDCSYDGTGEALNCFDDGIGVSICSVVDIENCFFNVGSTVTMTGLTRVHAEILNTGEPVYAVERWVRTVNANLNTAVLLRTITTTGNVGVGTSPSSTAGQMLTVQSTGNTTTSMRVLNTNAGNATIPVAQVISDTSIAQMSAYSSAVAASLFGVTIGSYSALTNGSTGSGLLVGTGNEAPLILGTFGVAGMKFNGTKPHPSFPISDKRVTTQFDKTDTTLAAVTGLTVDVVAGKTYEFTSSLYTTSNVAGGVKFAIAGTATATAIVYEAEVWNAGAATAPGTARATALGATVGNVTAVTAARVMIYGTITVNAAGTLLVQFAENAATATSSVLVGSSFKVREVA